MEEEQEIDFAIEKTRTALSVMDLAFHPNTSDQESLAAIRAYRRLSKGKLPSILFGDCDAFYLEDIWQERYTEQELEINQLRNENKKLKKALGDSRRRRTNGEEPKKECPSLTMTDAEWARVELLVPTKQQCQKGRERIAAIIVILRTGCGWRVLGTPEKPFGWTTYYNQLRSWQKHQWWKDVLETLECEAA